MRCQHVDDDLQCRSDATRRVLVGCGDLPDPDQAGFAGTVYMVMVCKQHDPDLGARCRCLALPVPFRSASVRGGTCHPAPGRVLPPYCLVRDPPDYIERGSVNPLIPSGDQPPYDRGWTPPSL